MGAKLLVPSHDNREACLQQLWSKLYIEQGASESTTLSWDWLTRALNENSIRKAALAANDIARDLVSLAVIERRRQAPAPADDLLRKSFAFVYWSRELSILARMDPEWYQLSGDSLLMPLVTWQALSPVCGAPWFALWLAPHLHNQFAYPGGKMPTMYYSLDKPASLFMEILQRSLVTRQWPEDIRAGEMAGYGELLSACGDETRWQQALVDFCDWRVANAYGYAHMGAPKRRRQSEMWSVLDAERVEQVFPVELFTLRFAFERATGKVLTLDAPHPMLQSPMMTLPFPSVEPMFQDNWTTQLAALRAEHELPLRSTGQAKYINT